MARVIPHARDPLDELGHARQRPQLRAIAERLRPLQQRLLDLVELDARYARLAPGASGAAQTLASLAFPRLGPAHRRRPTHTQPTGDRRLRLPLLE